jgi:probable F420-dependent oxidoreductase
MIVVAGMSDRLLLNEVGAYAQFVESLGYDVLQVPETIHDSMAVALLALEHTTTLRVQTSLTLAFPRSPMLLALQSWDLSRMSEGRFGLGLGTQIRQNIEGRFGVPWSDPIQRMDDYSTAVRACWSSFQTGEPLKVDTANYRLDRLQPFFNPGPLSHDAPELLLGGVNNRAIELAGRSADWFVTHPTNSHPKFLQERALPALKKGSNTRTIPPITVTTASPLITGKTRHEVELSLDRQRAVLAFLYSTPAYRRTLELFGWAEVGQELQTLTRNGNWSQLKDLLTDDMMTTLLPMGTWSEMPAVLSEWFKGLCQAIMIQPPEFSERDQVDDDFLQLVAAVKKIK